MIRVIIYIDNFADEAEDAAGNAGNMKQLYDTTRRLVGKFGKRERPVKGKPVFQSLSRIEKPFQRAAVKQMGRTC